ncbi:MAG: hypothetical protein AB7P02_13870 [Alphaproteobacteria bacterium]
MNRSRDWTSCCVDTRIQKEQSNKNKFFSGGGMQHRDLSIVGSACPVAFPKTQIKPFARRNSSRVPAYLMLDRALGLAVAFRDARNGRRSAAPTANLTNIGGTGK